MRRKNSKRRSPQAVMPPVSDLATTATSSDGFSASPFLLMGGGYQAAAYTDTQGFIYWPNVDTRRQITQWTRYEIARRIQFLYAHFGFARKLVNGMARIMGYLPVVVINDSRTELADRMASTIRHNRARGKHQVEAMSDIVIELKRRNWSDEKIAKLEADSRQIVAAIDERLQSATQIGRAHV